MATEQQIPKLAGLLVEHQGAFAVLSTDDAQWVINNTKSAISLFVGAVKNRVEQAKEKLLEFLTTFKVAGAKRFVANDNFKVDVSEEAVVKISYLNPAFKANFLGLVEENVPEADLKVRKLLWGSRDPWIIVELGDKYTVSLAHVRNAMALQPKGEDGKLLTNGWANIFYVADVNGVVWAVGVGWRGGGWSVGASSVGRQYVWCAGDQVLSR